MDTGAWRTHDSQRKSQRPFHYSASKRYARVTGGKSHLDAINDKEGTHTPKKVTTPRTAKRKRKRGRVQAVDLTQVNTYKKVK